MWGFKAGHQEEVTVSGRRDLGDTGGGGNTTGVRDAVGCQVHWPTAGDSSAVGGPATTPGGLCEVNRLRGRELEEKVVL